MTGGTRIPYHSLIGDVRFEHVTFAYPNRADAPVIADLSLDIPAGTTLALVGASGAGKSTIVALLERFYDPSAGRITIDGHDVRALDATWLRTHALAFIGQEPVLFDTTIEDNIRFGHPSASAEQVEAAARAAHCDQFIAALPSGYATHVGERGAQLSGGQKQRVAIARALLKNAPILILDEATSALDSESESAVHDALEKAAAGRTVIIIAHRLSTIRNAQRIAVIGDGGRLVETGTHDELMRRRKVYWRLVNRQFDAEVG